jgi:hypothetical protein
LSPLPESVANGDLAADPQANPRANQQVGKILQAFVRDGRLIQVPARRSKRLVVLELLAQEFEPGRRFTEPEVNVRLQRWHPDYCALRRHLVDEGFLDRADGEYWRCGGQLDIDIDGTGPRWATQPT